MWVLVALSVLVVILILAILVVLIVWSVKRIFVFRKRVLEQEELLNEVAKLETEVIKLQREKENIMALKVSQLGLTPDQEYVETVGDETEEIADGIMKTTRGETTTTNNLYILDEELKEIGKIENLANDERIYSVRFIGKVGYIVTFKQIDPLFVIDLSDPTNPTVKGELKIPGYSSYLHPYDETHIIGIGYNTKDNGHGGVTNANMKMSMFDVSDLENPKEIFNVNIGNEYASSEITYNHKALFYKKSENLIGFPVTYREYNYRDDSNGFIIFKIDLEENEFEKYGEILNQIDYRTNVKRITYIENIIYALSEQKITSYDLNTFEKLNEVNLKEIEEDKFGEIYETEIMYDVVDGVIE